LQATRQGDRIEVHAEAVEGCAGWEPVRVVARRAGRTPTGPLQTVGDCGFAGSVQVDAPGRWFVYAELTVDGRFVEAWLPVEHTAHRKDTVLYVASGDGPHLAQVVAGALLYALVLGIFAAIVVAYRRTGPSAGTDGGRGAAEGVAVGAR
jgi:hypothetical protein